MSRLNELSGALVKREMEGALKEAGLSVKDSKKAVSVFSRYLDQAPGVEPGKYSIMGKLFSRLKMRLRTSQPAPSGKLG